MGPGLFTPTCFGTPAETQASDRRVLGHRWRSVCVDAQSSDSDTPTTFALLLKATDSSIVDFIRVSRWLMVRV